MDAHVTTPAPKKPFALAQRAAAETAVITIYDPADPIGKPDTGLRVEILSAYSDEARAAAEQGSLEQYQEWLFNQTVAITKRWWDVNGSPDGIIEEEGGPVIPATPEHVRRIYSDTRFRWIQRQVQAAYTDQRSFFSAPKANS